MPRKKGSVVVYFRWHGQRLTASGKTHDEAIANKALKLAALEAGTLELTGNTQVKIWIKEWIETYKAGEVNAAWLRDIKGICNNYIVSAIGTVPIRNVKPIQLQKIINSNNKSVSFNKKLYDIIRQIFREAYHNRLTQRDISESLTPAKGTSKRRRSITDQERAVLLHVLEGHRGKIFCYLMLYAGLRPGEAAALQWKDVDLKNRVIAINKALKSDGTIKNQPKTDAGNRTIPIQNTLYDALAESPKSPFAPVCVNERGNAYTRRTIESMWQNVRRLMDIEMGARLYRNKIIVHALADDFYLYDLRHTFCTDLQAAGVPINVARELMGHADISVTSKIYTHHSDISIDDARVKMEAYVKKGLPEGLPAEGQNGTIRDDLTEKQVKKNPSQPL